ncbi:TasA family protein [Bacillus nitroreducens]
MSIKKKIGGAVIATALGAALIGGGSYALFTAEAVNEGNTFATGGVTIDDVNSTFSAIQHISNLAPGDKGTWEVTIKNTDSLAAWVQVSGYDTNGDLFDGDNPVKVEENNQILKIEPGQEKTFNFSFEFPEAAGNEYQGKIGDLTINFQAVQVKNNDAGTEPISWN